MFNVVCLGDVVADELRCPAKLLSLKGHLDALANPSVAPDDLRSVPSG